MSEPVSKVDVDDVLSSIRRMVDENRVAGHPDGDYASSRLVLTPQLRVTEDDLFRLEPRHARAAADQDETGAAVILDSTRPIAGAEARTSAKAPSASLPLRAPVHKAADYNFGVFELSAKIAALETAIGRIPGQWEPDGTGADAYSGTKPPAMDWPATAELDATGAPVSESEADDAPEAAESAAVEDAPAVTRAAPQDEAAEEAAGPSEEELQAEEQVIDEAALRELVADIVRSELQGPLGERITRNVRKLVRMEIQRALAAKELE